MKGLSLSIIGTCRVADRVGKVFETGQGRAGKTVVVNAAWEGNEKKGVAVVKIQELVFACCFEHAAFVLVYEAAMHALS